MEPLTLSTMLNAVQQYIEDTQHRQITDSTHPDYGALVNPEFDLPDAKMDGNYIAACALYVLGGNGDMEQILSSTNLAADHMLKAQRPSGNVDLWSVNYDSAPDTAFTVQNLCHIFELRNVRNITSPHWDSLLEKLETFIRRGVAGMTHSGFHTPNHRWVMVSAMVQAKTLFPDLDVEAAVKAYLDEGIDVDEEGAFIERSVGVYDAVTNRSLLMIAENWDCPDAIEAVERNLHFDLHLLHGDGTAETGLSRRQDYGTREVPVTLIPCYLLCNHVAPNSVFLQAAHTLWQKNQTARRDLLWLTYALFKCGDPASTEADLPENFARFFPQNGLWRVRQGPLSVTAFQGVTRLLTLSYGKAELASLKISQTYFGHETGRFISDSLTAVGNRAVLRSEGRFNPRRPGYELPLGKPVPPDQWQAMLQERRIRRLPPAVNTLAVQEVDGGVDLHYQTVDGLDGVAAQIAFDFPTGGIWETDTSRLMPQAGQVIFLKQGTGHMRYGTDEITISPGTYAHGMWAMREAETAPNHVRILLTLMTPLDFVVEIRAGKIQADR